MVVGHLTDTRLTKFAWPPTQSIGQPDIVLGRNGRSVPTKVEGRSGCQIGQGRSDNQGGCGTGVVGSCKKLAWKVRLPTPRPPIVAAYRI